MVRLTSVNTVSVSHEITYDQIAHIVLNYLQLHPLVKPEELNSLYIRAIVKDFLRKHGESGIEGLDNKLLLKKQDLLLHIRGM